MNIAVIGLGSMGKRRVRLLLDYIRQEKATEAETWTIYGVDAREDRRDEAEKLYHIRTCEKLSEALSVCQAAIVSTSPLSHRALIHECLMAGVDVFTEINLVSNGYEENVQLAEAKQRVLFLSSTFLYRRENQYIIKTVQEESAPLNYTYHIGHDLPDWHPWEAVQDYFIGDKRTNGCREIMAIDFPWLVEAFGRIKSIDVKKSCNTVLPIDYSNNYLLLIEHETSDGKVNKGMVAIDVMSRKAVRNMEVFNENLYLSWNGSPQGLYHHNNKTGEEEQVELYEHVIRQEGYSNFVIENAYYGELAAFLQAVEQRDLTCGGAYGFCEDHVTLDWIDRIEAADA